MGKRLAQHELQLGAEEADTAGAGLVEVGQVDDEAGIELQLDPYAVARLGGKIAQRGVALALALADRDAALDRLLQILARAHQHDRLLAVRAR